MSTEPIDTGLAKRMILLADAHQLPENHELRVRAMEFERATTEWFLGRCSPRRFMGIWARARRCYTEVAGKGLMED